MRYLLLILVTVCIYSEYALAQSVNANVVRLAPTALPATCNVGDLRVDTGDSYKLKLCGLANTWAEIGGTISIGTINTATKSANGLVFAAGVLTAQTADTSFPGLISTGTQSIAGAKTFTGAISASNLTGTNSGDVTLGTASGLSLVGQALSLQTSSGSQTGALTGADWTTFNGKQPAGSYLTALTGDGTAAGPGSSALTLATVNSNVGSFGTATQVPAVTVNAKGLVTAASNTSIQLAESQVTDLTTDLAGKASTTLNNLGTTSINANLLPSATLTRDLGTTSNVWNNIYGFNFNARGDSATFRLSPASDTGTTGSFSYNGVGYFLTAERSDTNQGTPLYITTSSIAGANANGSGSIGLQTGDKTAGTGDSGSIALTTGTSAGGSRGRINLNDGTEGLAGTVWTANNNAGGGRWQIPNVGLNFIAGNPDAEAYTNGWTTYADAAGVYPVDGTGGSPSSTWTRTTSSPLTGNGSFLWTKSANNRQGEGVSYDFTIDSASKVKVLTIEFDYEVASGTFVAGSSGVDSDLEVYIYDVTNGTLIQPSSYKLFSNSTTLADRFRSTFQTASNSTSYRLIIHTATTSASAYTIKFDSISVSPSKYVYGSPITDWVDYTPTFTGFGTVTAIAIQWRRNGPDLEMRGKFTPGTTTGVEGRLSFPSGLTSASGIASLGVAGNVVRADAGAFTCYVLNEPSVNYFTFGVQAAGTAGYSKALGNVALASSTAVGFFASVPILGWSSSVQMSNDTDTRVIGAVITSTSTQSVASSASKFQFNTIVKDTSGSFDATTNYRYTVPVSGIYEFTGAISYGAASALLTTTVYLYKNGVQFKSFQVAVPNGASFGLPFAFSDDAKAGDYYEIFAANSTTTSAISGASLNIFRLSGPSAIATSESVNMSYTGTSTSLTNNTTIQLVFNTKVIDTHNIYSAGTATLPSSGTYFIRGAMTITDSSGIVGRSISITKNGTVISYLELDNAAAGASTKSLQTIAVVNGLAGDLIKITGYQNTGGAIVPTNDTGTQFNIYRVGN